MSLHLPVRRAGLGALVTVVALWTVAVAARNAPLQGGNVIQVRDFPSSSVIEVVAWNTAEPRFGLRTTVRRSGGVLDRYHRLWVNSDYPGGRDVSQAQGLSRPLPLSNGTDTQNCLNGKCTPGSTFGARIPDGPFRSSKDDLAVKFITSSASEFTLTARRGLIDAYLATIDSVAAALKK